MAIKRREKKFNGIDLNETNVEAIFNDCLPNSLTQNTRRFCIIQ